MSILDELKKFSDEARTYEKKKASGTLCTNPHNVWISLFFDGTGNNLDLDKGDDKQSNVAKLYDAHQLKPESGIEKSYFIGVGTRSDEKCPYTWVRDSMVFGGGFGAGGKSRIAKARAMLSDVFQRNAKAPNKTVALFGFSRGAALARYMAHLLCEEGIEIAGGKKQLRVGQDFDIGFVGIFDTVSSFYFPGTDFSLDYDFDIPKEVKKVVHLVAAHERRAKFDLQSIRTAPNAPLPPGWIERIYPGMHSDVGGGYGPEEQGRSQDFSKIALNAMYDEAVKAGVPLHSRDHLKSALKDYAPLYEPTPEAEAALKAYQTLAPDTTDLEASLSQHERLYYRWLKHCLDRGGWCPDVLQYFRAEESVLSDKLKPLKDRVQRIHRENLNVMRERSRQMPRAMTGSEVQAAARLETVTSVEYKKLKDTEGALDALRTSEKDLDHAFLSLQQEYQGITWRIRHDRKLPVSWPPPFMARLGNPHRDQIQIRPLTPLERQIYQWMEEAPLPESLILMFDQWVHDSVAHTPDPLGDSYFAARDIYYQHDGQWQQSQQKESA